MSDSPWSFVDHTPEPAWKSTWRSAKSFAFISGMLSYQSFFLSASNPLSFEQQADKIAQIQKVFDDQDVQDQLKKDPKDFSYFLGHFLNSSMPYPEVLETFLKCTQAVSHEPDVVLMYWGALMHSSGITPQKSINMLLKNVKQFPELTPSKALYGALNGDLSALTQMVLDTVPPDTIQEWMVNIPRTVRRRGNQSLALVRQTLKAHAQHQALTQACGLEPSRPTKSLKL